MQCAARVLLLLPMLARRACAQGRSLWLCDDDDRNRMMATHADARNGSSSNSSESDR